MPERVLVQFITPITNPGDKHRKNTLLQRATSASVKYDKSARGRLEQRRLGTVNWVPEDATLTKSSLRGWRQITMYLFQGNNCNLGQTVFKRANSRKREER